MIMMRSTSSTSSSVIALTLVLVVSVFLALPTIAFSRHISRPHSHRGSHHHHHQQQHTTQTKPDTLKRPEAYKYWGRISREVGIKGKVRGPDTLQVAGSSLPDCSHACGSCRPCRLVMVSFVCSTLQEAETCPMAYKCMCRNKSYPVP